MPFGYDGFGRRVRTGCVSSGSATQFVFDGHDMLLELNAGGDPVREYTYHAGGDRPHSVKGPDGTVLYYQTDDPGNVVGLTDASNNVVARTRYEPWGLKEYDSRTVVQPLGYPGAYMDAGGLYHMRARWYDPNLGRFLSEDPIGLRDALEERPDPGHILREHARPISGAEVQRRLVPGSLP